MIEVIIIGRCINRTRTDGTVRVRFLCAPDGVRTGGLSLHQCAQARAHFSRVSATPWYALKVSCRCSPSSKQPRLGCRLHGGVAADAGGTLDSRGMAPCTEPVSSGLTSWRVPQQQILFERQLFYVECLGCVRTKQRAVAHGSPCRMAGQAPLLSILPPALRPLRHRCARSRECAWRSRHGFGISRHHRDYCGRPGWAAADRSTPCVPAWP